MTDTTTAAQAARIATETEASREVSAQAAADNPNPTTDDGGQRTDAATADPSSVLSPPPSEPKPLERITSADRSRADIAARFKEKRAAHGGQVEFHGDMRDPSQTYGPYVAQTTAPTEPSAGAPAAEATPAPIPSPQGGGEAQAAPPVAQPGPAPAEPRLIKVKVHGVETWMNEGDVIAEAQKSLAAGNLLESAKEVLNGARGQMSDASDQMSESGDPTSDGARSREGGGHPSSDPYVALAQTLQLENAESAGTRLKQTIENETVKARQEAAREAARQVRIENELAVSHRALAGFEKAHPDLAADEFARDAITTQVQREINADLQKALADGILKELPRSQDERNGLHTQLRAFGAPVRSIGDIFDAAGSKYATWRGGPPSSALRATEGRPAPASQPQPQPTASTAPRVELTTARQERRAQIPTQPTNGTAPPRAAAPAPELTTAQRRSAAVMAMRRARGQIVA
jgi:hypothetical protein